jgi:DNA polymerase V
LFKGREGLGSLDCEIVAWHKNFFAAFGIFIFTMGLFTPNIERSFYLVPCMSGLYTFKEGGLPVPSHSPIYLPYCSTPIPAGFPSPAEGYLEEYLSLDQQLIQDRESTVLLRCKGDSMIDAHICAGDWLIVDRGRQAISGDIVVAALDGEFTLKRLILRGAQVILQAENPAYQPIFVQPEQELELFGVLTGLARRL